MSWLVSLLVAIVAGILGLFAAGFIADAYTHWYHVSQQEGGAGYFVIIMALLGGIVSAVFGLVVARVVASMAGPGVLKEALIAWGAVTMIHGLVWLACYWFADIPPTIGGDELQLEVEIKLPVTQQAPPNRIEGEPFFQLESIVNHTQRAVEYGRLLVDQSRQENGRWIVPAEVFVFTSRGNRGISSSMGETELGSFLVPLPAYPDPQHERWSEWLPKPPDGQPPWPDTKSSYRFRVRRIPPPPPPPTQEEMDAQKEAGVQAVFDSIPPDAPISAWLPYTAEWQDAKRREVALNLILSRKDYVAALGELMLDEDPRKAEEALRLIGLLQAPDLALIHSVAAAGRDIIQRIKQVNETTIEQDPSYEAAADASIRFSSWMVAVRALRKNSQGDFTAELQEILNLSRVRSESIAMRDICRIASFHMNEWAGVEPFPDDPAPN